MEFLWGYNLNFENNHYYEHLAELYPTISSASSEIINLQSILHLPKGTEHFLSDIHGEYDAFSHVYVMVRVRCERRLMTYSDIL